MSRVRTIVSTVRHLGPKWAAYRVRYSAQQKCGVFRRATPARSWDDVSLNSLVSSPTVLNDYAAYRRDTPAAFFFDCSQREQYSPLLRAWDLRRTDDAPAAVELADDVCEGWSRYFESQRVWLGERVDWHRNPFSQRRLPSDGHWSQINEFGSDDIKLVWEPNRFAFVYPLVRAYWRTGDPRYAERFWQLLESWAEQNPPQQGVNWKCGQEVALRLMAWCFALYGFADCVASDNDRQTRLLRMVALSAQRIAANIQYALSQKNNHGVSEAAGLFTAGILFPELCQSGRWQRSGRRHLQNLAAELVYHDGAFSQHSVNYHRVMLQLYTWCIRLGELNGVSLGKDVRQSTARAARFLYQIQDESSGRVPRYGQYDGALVLPLSTSDQSDYRPAIQAALMAGDGQKLYPAGGHDEEALWLCGLESLEGEVAAPRREDFSAIQGGCHTVRSQSGFAMIRSGGFRHRPSQADMLHCDVWWRGLNMALDPGTFSYSAPPPWNNPLAATRYHNTVTVDGQEQMERVSRFLWLPWIHPTRWRRQVAEDGWWTLWQGGHDGFERRALEASYRRTVVRLGDEHWLVLDRLWSPQEHDYRLHWLAPDYPLTRDDNSSWIQLQTPQGNYRYTFAATTGTVRQPANRPLRACAQCVRADPDSPRGWMAPTYFTRQPAHSLSLHANAQTVTFATLLGPGQTRLAWQEETLQIGIDQRAVRVQFSPGVEHPIERIIHNETP